MKKKRKSNPKFVFHTASHFNFLPIWLSNPIEINPDEFEAMFIRYKAVWNDLEKYLTIHPQSSGNYRAATQIKKDLNCPYPLSEYRRIYSLVWQKLKDGEQRFRCDPNLYRRMVGLWTAHPSHNEMRSVCLGLKLDGVWTPPEEYWKFNIHPTNYTAIEEIRDDKGNISYVFYVLCLDVEVETIKDMAKWYFAFAKETKVLRKERGMEAFLPNRTL